MLFLIIYHNYYVLIVENIKKIFMTKIYYKKYIVDYLLKVIITIFFINKKYFKYFKVIIR